MDAGRASDALAAFVTSCPRLVARSDTSGLTRPQDWSDACNAAAGWPAADARRFLPRSSRPLRSPTDRRSSPAITSRKSPGTRQPGSTFRYSLPPDLVRAKPGDAPPLPDGLQPKGRYDETGRFVPYYSRAEIEDGALAGRGLELAWAADPIAFFFLQIQGSGGCARPMAPSSGWVMPDRTGWTTPESDL
jgi:membrane-bound lytic murein transglycosylase A